MSIKRRCRRILSNTTCRGILTASPRIVIWQQIRGGRSSLKPLRLTRQRSLRGCGEMVAFSVRSAQTASDRDGFGTLIVLVMSTVLRFLSMPLWWGCRLDDWNVGFQLNAGLASGRRQKRVVGSQLNLRTRPLLISVLARLRTGRTIEYRNLSKPAHPSPQSTSYSQQ